jgi:Txe/YoeB family toxin of Txe-Axe toxin-antitoxin module
MKILSLSKLIEKKIKKYNLQVKFSKQLKLLSLNPKHTSLNVELLEPKEFGIYSFRIDRKFRGLFIFREDKKALEIINITVHYH